MRHSRSRDEDNLFNMSDEITTQIATTAALPAANIEVTAENMDEMADCQSALIQWCKEKVLTAKHEAKELQEAYEHAVKAKWKSGTLKRHAELAIKRLDYYSRILEALEHGYQIVPSFPITAFAIRTEKKNPLKLWTTSSWQKHTQESEGPPAGEGDYKNPFPMVLQKTLSQSTTTQNEKMCYWASAWKELEFPVTMAKPKIMRATTRAMALRIFDDIGILPGYAPSEGTRPPRGDPIIVARICAPKKYPAESKRWVSFIVGWHLNTADL